MPPRRRSPARPLGPALCLLLASLPGRAAEAPAVPVPPPLPPERPAELKAPAPPEAAGALQAPPQPPARPAELTPPADAKGADAKGGDITGADIKGGDARGEEAARPPLPTPAPTPPERPPELSGEAALALKVAAPDDTACRVRLKRLGAAFEPLPPISDGQCSAPLPLKVSALADGVALRPGATLTCGAAEALARWATEVQVEAERAFKGRLTAIEVGGSYVCRGQNHDTDAKLSEHAFADAVDVMGFDVAGRSAVIVKAWPAGAPEAEFIAASRAKACGFFRTVLGPGTNAEHGNHLHLDERERSAGHRLCQ